MDDHSGLSGWWLRSGVAEAFVCALPYPRLAEFRTIGSESMTIPGESGRVFFGVRTCFMEPHALAESSNPGLQPAAAIRKGSRSVLLESLPDDSTELQLLTEYTLDACRPRLIIKHGVRNLSDRQRNIALWALAVLPAAGKCVVPWGREENGIRSVSFLFDTDPDEPAVSLDQRGLFVDLSVPPLRSMLKVGSNSDIGWVACIRGSRALVSSVDVDGGAEYPEGGSTITVFASDGTVDFSDEVFCEMENVGPLRLAGPGETLYLDQRLDILEFPSGTGGAPALSEVLNHRADHGKGHYRT